MSVPVCCDASPPLWGIRARIGLPLDVIPPLSRLAEFHSVRFLVFGIRGITAGRGPGPGIAEPARRSDFKAPKEDVVMGEIMADKLFVGNLPRETTENELSDLVTAAGFQIASSVVIRDKMTGQSRGFGFVELADGEDIQKAIEALNGQELGGRKLTVNEARPRRTEGPRPSGGRPRRGGGGGGGGGGGYGRRRDY